MDAITQNQSFKAEATALSLASVSSRIRELCADPKLAGGYEETKRITRAFRRPAFYEVSGRCNLLCEGCYYFESADAKDRATDKFEQTENWRSFFRSEKERGVSMAYFVGAEPALHPDRLLSAAEFFPYAQIGTNGSIFIDRDVPYRISISAWAVDDEVDRRLRGASVLRKALKLYRDDPRAIVLLTISALNIDEIRLAAEICQDHNLELTFNFYSPTDEYLRKMASSQQHDGKYFRWSRDDDSPILSAEDLRTVREELHRVIEDFPETVILTHAMCDRLTQDHSLHTIGPDGVAVDCRSRITGRTRYFDLNRESKEVKCCTPSVDCRTCRMYSGGWSSRLLPTASDLESPAAFASWIDDMKAISRIFLVKQPVPELRHGPDPHESVSTDTQLAV